MDLQDAVVCETQAGINDEHVFGRDDGERLYFDQQATCRPLLQVVLADVERYKAFGLVDSEGSL